MPFNPDDTRLEFFAGCALQGIMAGVDARGLPLLQDELDRIVIESYNIGFAMKSKVDSMRVMKRIERIETENYNWLDRLSVRTSNALRDSDLTDMAVIRTMLESGALRPGTISGLGTVGINELRLEFGMPKVNQLNNVLANQGEENASTYFQGQEERVEVVGYRP